MPGEGAARPPAAPEEANQEKNGGSPEHKVISPSEIIERATKGMKTKWIHVDAWDCDVQIRSLTALERARIREVGIIPGAGQLGFVEMEVQQFLAAVVEPKFNEHEVRKLQQNGDASGFAAVIDAHDAFAMMGKEEIRQAREQFQSEKE